MCKITHITLKYIHVKVNGNNLGCINAKQAAKWGGGLNEQLYKIHVECDINEC